MKMVKSLLLIDGAGFGIEGNGGISPGEETSGISYGGGTGGLNKESGG